MRTARLTRCLRWPWMASSSWVWGASGRRAAWRKVSEA
jgi:hypothetical protein